MHEKTNPEDCAASAEPSCRVPRSDLGGRVIWSARTQGPQPRVQRAKLEAHTLACDCAAPPAKGPKPGGRGGMCHETTKEGDVWSCGLRTSDEFQECMQSETTRNAVAPTAQFSSFPYYMNE